eukprot:764442-Hanusia_phi.AAC.8
MPTSDSRQNTDVSSFPPPARDAHRSLSPLTTQHRLGRVSLFPDNGPTIVRGFDLPDRSRPCEYEEAGGGRRGRQLNEEGTGMRRSSTISGYVRNMAAVGKMFQMFMAGRQMQKSEEIVPVLIARLLPQGECFEWTGCAFLLREDRETQVSAWCLMRGVNRFREQRELREAGWGTRDAAERCDPRGREVSATSCS